MILRHGAAVEMGQTAAVFCNPQHPYTRMLLSAVPQLHCKWQALEEPQRGVEYVRASANGSRGRAAAAAYLARFSRPPARALSHAELDRALTPPVLTECEPGHLVAGEEEPSP